MQLSMYSESTRITLDRTSLVVDMQVDLIGVDLVPTHIIKSGSASIHGSGIAKRRHR